MTTDNKELFHHLVDKMENGEKNYPPACDFKDMNFQEQLCCIKNLSLDLQQFNLLHLIDMPLIKPLCQYKTGPLPAYSETITEEFIDMRKIMGAPNGFLPSAKIQQLDSLLPRICNKNYFPNLVTIYNLNRLIDGEQTPFYVANHTISAVEKVLQQPLKADSNGSLISSLTKKSLFVEFSLTFLYNFLWAYLEYLYPLGKPSFGDRSQTTKDLRVARYSELQALESIQERSSKCLEELKAVNFRLLLNFCANGNENAKLMVISKLEAALFLKNSRADQFFLEPVSEYIETRVEVSAEFAIFQGKRLRERINLLERSVRPGEPTKSQEPTKTRMGSLKFDPAWTQKDKDIFYKKAEAIFTSIELQTYHEPAQILCRVKEMIDALHRKSGQENKFS